jgi:hypothetical protein
MFASEILQPGFAAMCEKTCDTCHRDLLKQFPCVDDRRTTTGLLCGNKCFFFLSLTFRTKKIIETANFALPQSSRRRESTQIRLNFKFFRPFRVNNVKSETSICCEERDFYRELETIIAHCVPASWSESIFNFTFEHPN